MSQLTLAFARERIAHLPTPIERLRRLEAELHVDVPVYVKRDDCTGLATGGNKVRQLEFYVGEALAQGATRLLVTGAVQSNFVRATAAFAARLGLACTVQLEDRVDGKDVLYHTSGNVLLDHLFGAEVLHHATGEDEAGADAALEAAAEAARLRGEVPYVIHLSETPRPLGALGYVAAAEELLADFERLDVDLGTVVVPSGSASTHAGLLTGLRAAGRDDLRVLGACVRRPAAEQRARVLRVCTALTALMGHDAVVDAGDVQVTDAVFEGGYGVIGATTREAIRMGARLEALVLDPVYSAKGFAALIGELRGDQAGRRGGRAVTFVHTGGLPAVFAYGDAVLG